MDPSFGQEGEEFKWYPIPVEKQETERRPNVYGYNNPLSKLAQGIHWMRPGDIEQFYCDTAAELRKQWEECIKECVIEDYSFEMVLLLERAAKNAQQQQTLFAEIRALSLAKKGE